MKEFIRVYDDESGYVDVGIQDRVVYVSAHCNGDKYSNGMMRKFKEVAKLFGKARTQLSYNYLVDFYSKHFDLELLYDDVYEIRSK